MKKNEFEHIAKLSFINLTDNENIEFEKQLNELIDHIENTLDNIDLHSSISKDISLNRIELFRQDTALENNLKDGIFTNIRREKNGFVIVPKIIKGDN